MPQADPLNNIMGMLRRSNSIDPGTAQARQARMSTDRRQMGPGASPTAQYNERPAQARGAPSMQGGTQEVAGAGQGLAQGQDMTAIMIDQMNETILSGKIQIHREQDSERKRMLESNLELLRQQILQLGGEPIWADETIEEGLQKLQGMGAVGAPQINEQLYGGMFPAGWEPGIPMSQPIAGQMAPQQGVPVVQQPNALGQTLQNIGVSNAMQDNIPRRDSGVGIRSYVEQAGGQVHWNQDDPLAAIIQGPMGQQRVGFSENYQGTGYAPEQAIREAMQAAGLIQPPTPGAPIRIGGQVFEMPTTPTLGDYNSAMGVLEAAGLSRDMLPSLEDWEAFKVGSAQKVAMGQRQIVERELARFENNWPNEFERAKKEVSEWAGEQKATGQEDMAARGMYYSSIMANSLGNIDEQAMDIIGEISRDAAQTVADLRAQIQDIDELEVLEIEIAKREARLEYFDQRTQLANMLAEVTYQRDTLALQQFQVETQKYMDLYHAETTRIQNEYDRMLQNQQSMALGMWAMNDPFLQQHISAAGMGDSFKNMNPYQQAALTESLVNVFIPLKQGEERHKLEMAYLTAQTSAENARMRALDAEAKLRDAETLAADKIDESQVLLEKFYIGEATPEEIDRLVQGGLLKEDGSAAELMELILTVENYMANPDTAGSLGARSMQELLLTRLAKFSDKSPELQPTVNLYRELLSNPDLLTPGKAKESLWDKLWGTRRKLFLEIWNDPRYSEELKNELIRRKFMAKDQPMPTAEERATWTGLPQDEVDRILKGVTEYVPPEPDRI